MPRVMRIQYPNARYHLINRGNYKADIFATEGAAQAFLMTLHESARRHGWKLHAYVLMSNHYHLAVETPLSNLVDGMHWLQGTFSNRFNRFRKQHGHVFQGRYKALVLEDAQALCRVVDYIHLNPVRAGIVTADKITEYAKSSLSVFIKGKREGAMECAEWLKARGGWEDNAAGLENYAKYLEQIGADEAAQKKAGLEKLSRGWALGTPGWKQALAKEMSQRVSLEGLSAEDSRELREAQWEDALAGAFKAGRKKQSEMKTRPLLQPWKLDMARKLRKEVGAPVWWIAKKLKLGKPSSVRSYMSRNQINAYENQQTST